MTGLAWTLPLLPAAGGLAGLLVPLGRGVSRRIATGIGLAVTGVPGLAALVLLLSGGTTTTTVRLADFGDIAVDASLRVDPRAAAVALAVSTVAFLVQLYSTGYLAGDDRYPPYAAQISLFTAAMLLVVTSDDLIGLLIGWEVMGACSYLLIGHDRRLAQAPAAAVKAFLVTRVGDVGFLLGVLLLGAHTGTFRIGAILAALDDLSPTVLTTAALLILLGALGKSAQFPLHTWLPDAMAGPTPISALIHAATMVAAGAYVLVRLFPLYARSTVALTVIAVLAAITMLLAACAALASDDLKRVLAWSTVSQVAFMFGGIAVLAPDAALFHLLAHAGFKALLFLCAGVVIHQVGGNSMSRMGGLWRGAPVTFTTMTIGFAALAGIPPLSGFWSKESILGAAFGSATAAGAVIWWAGLITVTLTAAYSARAWLRTFLGPARDGTVHPHDPSPVQRWPLIVLAVPAAGLGVGALGGPLTRLEGIHIGGTLFVLAAAAIGGVAVYLRWRRDPSADPATALGSAAPVFANGFGLDTAQDVLVVRPIRGLARLVRRADEQLVDGAVEATAPATGWIARRIGAGHASGLPRHLVTLAAGAVLLGAVTVAVYWGVTP